MNLVNPNLLFLLLLIIPLAVLLILIRKRYQKRFSQFAEEGFWEFYFGQWSFFFLRLKFILLLLALAMIILAMVRPQWDRETQDIRRSGVDIAICIDASKSMDATDILPSRLQRAKDQITSFINEQKGDRIALIPFAGSAFVQCPLTDDYEAARILLSSLTTSSMPVWGTDIGQALQVSGSVFDKNTRTKVVVLISDGEDLGEEALKTARELARQGIIVYAMGVGTPAGTRITLSGDEARGSQSGSETITKLDNETLEKIAKLAGGGFFMITPNQSEISAILQHIASLEKTRLSSVKLTLFKEQFQLFAIAALFLLLLEALLGTRAARNDKNGISKTAAAVLLALLLLGPASGLQALQLPWSKTLSNSRGNSEYKHEKYENAERTFGRNALNHPKDSKLQYNHGNSLYRMGKNQDATNAWQNALRGNDPKLRSRAWHNLGNAQFQAGQYQDAMQSYLSAVLEDETNRSAKSNYDLAKRKLHQQQQNKQQKQNQKQDQNQDKQGNKQSKPEQSQQKDQRESAERILKALEQKEISDQQKQQGSPQRVRGEKWW